MKIIEFIRKKRDDYVTHQVENMKFPDFLSGCIIRKNYVFTGKVQNVGFRIEVYHIANKTGLTGWIINTDDGRVEAEIQGEKSKIDFLIQYMMSLKRIKITHIDENEISIQSQEKEFSII